MQTLARATLEKGSVRCLVVPGPEGGTGLHRREDVDQSGMPTSLAQNPSNPRLLPEVLLPNVLDLQPVFSGETLGSRADLVPQRLRELRVVEQADASGGQRRCHRSSVTEFRQRARDDHPVKARKRSMNPVSVSFGKHDHHATIMLDPFRTVEWAA